MQPPSPFLNISACQDYSWTSLLVGKGQMGNLNHFTLLWSKQLLTIKLILTNTYRNVIINTGKIYFEVPDNLIILCRLKRFVMQNQAPLGIWCVLFSLSFLFSLLYSHFPPVVVIVKGSTGPHLNS